MHHGAAGLTTQAEGPHCSGTGCFDLRRRAHGHVAFGFGIHACIGAALARLEGEVLLAALARRVGRLELAGEPRRWLNNTLSGFASLPLRLLPAAL